MNRRGFVPHGVEIEAATLKNGGIRVGIREQTCSLPFPAPAPSIQREQHLTRGPPRLQGAMCFGGVAERNHSIQFDPK